MSGLAGMALLSVVAGLSAALSAVAGIGGGTILIGAMYAMGLPPLVALALHAGVQTVSNASRTLAYRQHVDWRHGALCIAVAAPLPFIVTPWLVGLDADLLRRLLGAFVLANLLPKPPHVEAIGLRARMVVAGVLKGALGPIVGASGLLLAPFFFSRHWSKEQTVATLAFVQAVGHVVKIAAYLAAGVSLGSWAVWWAPLALAVILGTALGRRIMGRISQLTFERVFKLVLAVLGLRLVLIGLV